MSVITLVPVADPTSIPHSESLSEYEDWGEFDQRAQIADTRHWLIRETDGATSTVVGSLSAHPVYYGPTAGSRAMNIGIHVLEHHRGRGIGTEAQRLLAQLLHGEGIIRVEAQTDVENLAEQRSLRGAGFVFEGVLRQAQGRRDGIHDVQSWSHLSNG